MPPIIADAPKVVWAIDFQFDSTIDRKAIKLASMIDEHTRESLLHVVERSITGERLVEELTKVFAAAGGPPKVLRMDNGPEMVSQALQRFCENNTGMVYNPPGCPWDNGYIEAINNRLRKACLTATTGTPVRGPHGHRRLQTRTQPQAPPPLGPGLPHTGRVRCTLPVHPHTPVACSIN